MVNTSIKRACTRLTYIRLKTRIKNKSSMWLTQFILKSGLSMIHVGLLAEAVKPWSSLWTNYGHYNDVIMGTMASQITGLTIVFSIVFSSADQSKHQSSASLAFAWRLHRGPVNSPHKWPVTQKMFPFDDVIMNCDNGIGILDSLCCTLMTSQWPGNYDASTWEMVANSLDIHGDIHTGHVRKHHITLYDVAKPRMG